MSARLLLLLATASVLPAKTRPFEFGRDIGGILTGCVVARVVSQGRLGGEVAVKQIPLVLLPEKTS